MENIKSDGTLGTVDIDYIYFGTEDDFDKVRAANNQVWQTIGDGTDAANDDVKTEQTEIVYGYDSAYENDIKLSNGSSLYVEGAGVPKMKQDANKNIIIDYANSTKYTEASFTFTGTGFDIISRTGKDQGSLRVCVCNEAGIVLKTITVANKGETELYQVPVVSVDLSEEFGYGTYTVRIFVNAAYDYNNDGNADKYHGVLDRGGEFYFDAVRIYGAIDTTADEEDSQYAYSLYQMHEEANPTFHEVRKMLIDAKNFDAESSANGVVYLDCKRETDEITVADYAAVGPNNEVYLKNGNAIAFNLVVEGEKPTSIDIGAKSADGTPVTLCCGVSDSAAALALPNTGRPIETCTAMYYPLTVSKWGTDEETGNPCIYVAVQNSGSGILSITNVKFGYNSDNQADAINFRFDRRMITALSTSKPTEPDPNLKFNMAITVGAAMNVGYSFMAAPLSEYESFYLEVSKNVAGGEPIVTVYDLTNLDVVNHPATGETLMYSATYMGINAKEMGDEFTATLYAVDADGRVHYGPTQTSSIKSYLLEKMSAPTASLVFKTMAVDMLKYGAAAQVSLKYDTENLVTADLTEEQLSYATKGIPEATDCSAITGNGVNINTSVLVATRVELGLSCIYSNATDPNTVKCVITDSEGKVLAELATANMAGVMYSAKYDNVGARQMREPIMATFYDGETAISKTLTWNIESYVAQIRAKTTATETEIAMVNAMLIYGDSVAAYLTSTGQ